MLSLQKKSHRPKITFYKIFLPVLTQIVIKSCSVTYLTTVQISWGGINPIFLNKLAPNSDKAVGQNHNYRTRVTIVYLQH